MLEDKDTLRGVVFNLQRYSIHDGPGIRTTVFLKGCPLACFWCQNPESQSLKPETFLNSGNCTLCGRCVKVCPTGAASLSASSSEIDREKCIGCGKCAEACLNDARKLAGRSMTVDEVVKVVLKDAKFYESSGGGVTLSGGEPTFQTKFALAILQECKHRGIHTTLETCGSASWAALEQLLEFVDFVLCDIKHVDSVKHQGATGRSNDIILENLKKIAALKPLMVRVPLIPGFNDSPEVIGEIARFVRSELNSVDLELLAYNKLGEGKYERLGRVAVPMDMMTEEHVESLRHIASLELGKAKISSAATPK